MSSFGVGGTNVHAVLAEAPMPAQTTPSPRPHQLITLGARTPEALAAIATELAASLSGEGPAGDPGTVDLADVAFTRAVGRRPLAYRRTLVVADRSELVAALRQPPRQVQPTVQEPRVVLLFPGHGSAVYAMAAQLHQAEPAFRQHLEHCLDVLEPKLARPLMPALQTGHGVIEDPELAHAGLFAVEYALAQLWLSWGVRPAALLGHSFGEYAAACVAGVLPLAEAADLTVTRGRLVARMPLGAMLAVALDEARLGQYLDDGVCLAAVNGEGRCVVSGPVHRIEQVARALGRDGHATARLPVRYAFHSADVEPVLADLARAAAQVRPGTPRLPLVSSVTGTWWGQADGDPAYWSRHMRDPVRFADGLATVAGDGSLVLLEVGPGQDLTALARAQLGRPARAVPSMGRAGVNRTDHRVLLAAVGALWQAGVAVDWTAFYRHERRRRIALPSYPFEGVDCRLPQPGRPPRPAAGGPLTGPAYAGNGGEDESGAGAESAASLDAEAADQVDAAGPGTGPDQPRDEVERRIFAIWQERLGTAEFGVHDNFLELGGNSLMAAQVLTRLREAFSVPIPLSTLFDFPTVAGIADQVRAMRSTGVSHIDAATSLPPISPAVRSETVPLSIVQRRTLDLTAIDPENPALLMPIAVELAGQLDVANLERAVGQILARHETLRTTFQRSGTGWHGQVRSAAGIRIEVEPCSPIDALARAKQEAATPIDLSVAPLRVRLLRLAEHRHVLLLTLHHVVSDTWSFVAFLHELAAGYQHQALDPLAVQY
ncbi:MAG TPA: acyltransferase domain-containing protein, partial [Micromonosporaceae bacterium]